MDAADKRMLEREALRNMIQQWNANRLDLFELSEPNESLEFHGVMRFYFQDSGQKIATKCIRVASDATVSDVIETLIEKFRPDMRMLSLGSYSLWETHGPDDERRLEPHEKPLLVQLNWHADDREGRFLLKCLTNNENNSITGSEKGDQNFKRKLSKREKKELKKKEKLSRLKSENNEEKRPVAEKLYTELPETSFTRSISNPEAVMRRRRHQKLERKLQQFRSKDGQPDTGGTLKIYGSSLCQDVPYKTLLLSVGDNAASVVREMLEKYGLSRHDPHHYCIVQVDTTDNSEYILEDDECPLAVVMTHPHSSSIMFHVRRRPADSQPRRRKKKTGSSAGGRPGLEPLLVEVSADGSALENGLRVRVNDVVEVGSGNGVALQLYGPSIQARHCVIGPADGGGYQVTPLHCDAGVWLDARPVLRPTALQHGSLLKFGRISTFRFVDPAQENMLNRNMGQAPHYGSGSIYDSRSPTSGDNASGAMSPTSMASHQPDNGDANANTTEDYPRTMSPGGHDGFSYSDNMPPYNNNTLKLDNESLMMSQHLNESKDDFNRDEQSGPPYNDQDQASVNRTANSQYKDNYETTFDLDGNVETKSICSAKSGGSGHDNRINASVASVTRPGQEAILPAVLEFPEAGQAQFLNAVVTRLDPHAPAFKLAPVYTLYLCARYRASTHYRPELSPTERAHKLTAFLHHVATLIHATVQERCTDSAAQAFWMANASELLHFLKCDRHISSFSLQAQDLLPTTVQNAFSNLVSCFQEELARALATLTNPSLVDASEATAPTLQALASAMVLLRRCRVNAALTIQLFSHLFHYINAVCFNKLVTEPGAVSQRWGAALSARLGALTAWAERQGLELAADCHLARTQQAARLIQGEYRTPDEGRAALEACFKLNSIQVGALLSGSCPADVVDACVGKARALADELQRADGRQIRLEESEWLGAALLIPGDGFSAEVVRGVPPGLAEFIAPLQRGGLCRLAHQPHAIGLWTVYMAGQRNTRPPDPRIHIIQLNKNSNGMGLSIVAAKGAGQSKLGIYIKSVVSGGAAAADGRLAAGDQLLSVDGHSLVGITQEKAAEYLVRTGPTVTLEVAKQGAVLHGLATLLHQPAYNQRQECAGVQYGEQARRAWGTFTNPHPALCARADPLTELVTAGYRRRPCRDRCHLVRDDSTESSTEDSEDCHPHYHGSIPRLIITLDHENNQLQEDLSPETPGCPLELKCHPAPPRPIPVFTFTCEDFDELQSRNNQASEREKEEIPPPIPEPPTNYDQSSETGEPICLPPQMRPIDTKLTLDLFNIRTREPDFYRNRCTGVDECVSACECCRAQQPEDMQIPYIDEPNSEPFIFENDCADERVATPKIRRILPSMSIDQSEECKPSTADAGCQTPSTPVETDAAFPNAEDNFKVLPKSKPQINNKSLILNLDVDQDGRKFSKVHHRLKRTLFSVSKSFSKSEETDDSSTFTATDSYNDEINYEKKLGAKTPTIPPLETSAKKILDTTDRKSWKSPDEYRPSLGTVKALTKHFNSIKLKYSVKNYQRNCQSSPNLSTREDKSFKVTENLPSSMSLADIQFESTKTDTSDTKGEKLSEDEVKSILIQLEDWSKFGSKGSGDTLAQGNEFELPNLPSEDHTDTNISNTGSLVFNEIIDKKPKIITLDNIKLKSNQSSINSVLKSKESLLRSNSIEKVDKLRISRVVAMIPSKHSSLLDVSPRSESRRESYATIMQSCPNVNCGSSKGRAACAGGNPHNSCPALGPAVTSSDALSSGENARRASERALVNSKSTPALHQPEPQNNFPSPALAAPAWAAKSRSSHNLAAPAPAPAAPAPAAASSQDAFYQNLATLQHQQLENRWSSLRSSGSNRPQSAHFSAQSHENPPDSPLHQQNHAAMNARAAKLAEMSDEVTRRQQLQLQHKQALSHHHNQMYTSQPVLNQNPLSPTLTTNHHLSQSQHINQMSPGQQVKNQNQHLMSPNQQIHNHMNISQPMSPNQHLMGSNQQLMSPNQQMMSPNQQMMSPSQQMMSPNQQMMSPNQQLLNQSQQMLNQSQQMLNQNQMHVHPGQGHVQYAGQPSPQLAMHQQPPPNQLYHNQNMTQQRYDWHPPGPPSPQRAQPPVAPKPQSLRRPDLEHEEHHPIQQPLNVSIHPDEDQYTSGAETGSLYNPWQREEREKQVEARRAAARDATIAHLISMGSNRTPMQNQQLRALQLERDIERRANQLEADDNTNTETGTEEEERISPERERMMSERDRSTSERDRSMVDRERTMSDRDRAMSERERGPPNPLPNPPKSILKTNKPEPQTNGFANENTMVRSPEPPAAVPTSATSGSGLQAAVPPVPERGSSFAVMARIKPAPTSPVGRDKRVSFHSNPPPPPPASSPPREDPDRFIEEAESMLLSPTSPGGAAPAQHTPGVIGAQEVYRDPRARRLEEQRARATAAPAAPVPEQLSFHEKMKMFALEAGDRASPKDKVKISRAQRDIDAVH